MTPNESRRGLTRRLWNVVIVNLAAISPLFAACDLSWTLERNAELKAQGRAFAAIRWLEQQQSVCPHPRLLLELGVLYADIGETDAAIRLWQTALTDTQLPDNVRSNVKLKIIKASLQPAPRVSGSLMLSVAHQAQTSTGQSSQLSASALAWRPFGAKNVFGYDLTPQLDAQLSLQRSYLWSSDTAVPLTYAMAGFSLTAQPAELSISTRLSLTETSTVPALGSEFSLIGAHHRLASSLEWRPTESSWHWREQFSRTGEHLNWRVSSTSRLQAQQWQWQDVRASVTGQSPVRPQLTLSWQPTDAVGAWRASARWPILDTLGLTLTAGSTFEANPDKLIKLSVNWRSLTL